MTCLGLPHAPCSKFLVVFQKLVVPLSLVGRLGMNGLMIAFALLVLRALVEVLQNMVLRPTDPWRNGLLHF